MKIEDEVMAIKTMATDWHAGVTSTQLIEQIVFHPTEPIMYVLVQGQRWTKARYEEMESTE